MKHIMLCWHAYTVGDSQKEFICENKICNNCEIKFSMQLGIRSLTSAWPVHSMYYNFTIII